MLASRPRNASGIVWFHIVIRYIALTASAPPATARHTTDNQSAFENPNATIARPHTPAAINTPRPWRRTGANTLFERLMTSAPIAGAPYSQPSAEGPPR